jgi:ribonuclease P protein component
LRPWRRSAHFVVYAKPSGQAARLGLVIGKKFAPRAATRNLIKRIAREHFRLRRGEFDGWDVLLRLSTRLDKAALPSAVSPPLRLLCHTEIEMLLGKVAREIARRGAAQPSTQPSPQAPSEASPDSPV